jgi:hypothetical protein
VLSRRINDYSLPAGDEFPWSDSLDFPAAYDERARSG